MTLLKAFYIGETDSGFGRLKALMKKGYWSCHLCKLLELNIFYCFFLLIEACLRVHKDCNEVNVEEQIGEVLKYAPSKAGGSRFKVTNYKLWSIVSVYSVL